MWFYGVSGEVSRSLPMQGKFTTQFKDRHIRAFHTELSDRRSVTTHYRHVTPQDPRHSDNAVQTRIRHMFRDRYLQEDLTSSYQYPSVWLSTLPRKKPKQKVVILLPEHAFAKKKFKILLPEGEENWVFSTETKHATVNLVISSNL